MGGNQSAKKASAPPPKQEPSSLIKTTKKLKGTIEKLEKRRNFIQSKIHHEVKQAKSTAKTNRKAALVHVKKKKMLEKDLNKLDGMIFSLEQQALTVETGSVNHDVLQAMSEGLKAQKKLNEKVDVDETAEMMDDIKMMQEEMEEVGEILGQGVEDLEYDDELMEELNAIDNPEKIKVEVKNLSETLKEEADAESVSKIISSLPEVPEKKTEVSKDEADEIALKALQAEMAS